MSENKKDKSFKKFIVYLFERFLFACFALVPFGIRAKFCEGIGIILYHFSGKYRRLVYTNLSFAFPDQPKEWIVDTAKKNFRILGRQLAEFIHTPFISESFFRRWFICEPDAEFHRNIYRNGGIVILGHLGNWEWHGFLAGHLAERDIYTLVKRHTNFWMNRWIEKSRHRANMQLIYIDQNPFITINKLRQGELVAFTSDQNAGGNGEFFPFFGRLASTYLGPAGVARNSKVPLYFVWSYHDEKGRLHFDAEELQRPEHIDSKKEMIEWEKAFTYMWVKKLEEKVRLHPADYLWSHNRWKAKASDPESVWAKFSEQPVKPSLEWIHGSKV